jgi:hypothetical protein
MDEAAATGSWITIIGTLITTAGTVLVALITTKTRRDQKTIQREAEDAAEDNKKEILGAIDELQSGLENNSRVTVANARAVIGRIYAEHKDAKRISAQTWSQIMELHDAYKSVKIDGHTPNSWCDQLVEEMKTWEKL